MNILWRDPALGPRGINGDIGELLFPLQHGTLWYVGYDVLPPVVVTGANQVSEDACEVASKELRERVLAIPTTAPIPFRTQSGGDYDDDLVLHDHHAPDRTGLGVHVRDRGHDLTETAPPPTVAECKSEQHRSESS